MIIREILPEEQIEFNKVVAHPLQSWQWGNFKSETGVKAIRLGVFSVEGDKSKLVQGWQLFVHQIPGLAKKIIYFPRGPMPDKQMLQTLKKMAEKENAVFVKLEPNVGQPHISLSTSAFADIKNFLQDHGCVSGKPLFTKYTFILDLDRPAQEILAGMKPKTRYNIRIAQKHQVQVVEDNSDQALEEFIKLLTETTNRQKFYGHGPDYYRKMKNAFDNSGIFHLLLSKYQGQTLAADIFFTFNKVLYYPYGASTRQHREVMASYGLFWNAINLGLENKCTKFDMWGSPGPDPNPKDAWYGFHHFKEGFGSQLYEFVGTYDLPVNPQLYKVVTLGNELRWKFLRLKKILPF